MRYRIIKSVGPRMLANSVVDWPRSTLTKTTQQLYEKGVICSPDAWRWIIPESFGRSASERDADLKREAQLNELTPD